jgi:hypothetical protein
MIRDAAQEIASNDTNVLLAERYGMLDRCVDWFSCVARNVLYSWGVLLTRVVEEPAGDTDVRV